MNSEKTQLTQKLEASSPTVEAVQTHAPNIALALFPDALDGQVTVLPAEHVALHVLDLPVRSARQRRDALPFALEERVGRPLDRTHFTICDTLPDGRVLAAVIDTAVMDAALATGPDRVIVPEQMLLPAEAQDSDTFIWTVFRHNDRVLVRRSDGTGFAVHASALPHMWRASGRPAINSYGAPLPEDLTWTDRSADRPAFAEDLARYDVRQGAYRPSLGLERPLRWLAAGIALTGLIHLALAFADMRAQAAIADTLRDKAATVLAERFPDATPDVSPALLQRQIMAQSQPQVGSTFLPLMNRVSQAWLSDGSAVQIRQLNWSQDALRLVVEAPDLEALQQAEARLSTENLTVSSGSATADAGSARAELTVRP